MRAGRRRRGPRLGALGRRRDGTATARDMAAATRGPAAGSPDEILTRPPEFVAPVEIRRRHRPAAGAAVRPDRERARRRRGTATRTQRDEIAALWARFNEVARRNPDAAFGWPADAGRDGHAGAAQPPARLPLQPRHSTQWTVDQASALLICSAEPGRRRRRAARPLALPPRRPALLRGRDAHGTPASWTPGPPWPCSAGRPRPGSGRSLRDLRAGRGLLLLPRRRARAAARARARPVGHADLTGGMAFAGGPFNHYVLLVDRGGRAACCASEPDELGLVTTVSGMLSKPGLAVWSRHPAAPSGRRSSPTWRRRRAAATEVRAGRRRRPRRDGAATVVASPSPTAATTVWSRCARPSWPTCPMGSARPPPAKMQDRPPRRRRGPHRPGGQGEGHDISTVNAPAPRPSRAPPGRPGARRPGARPAPGGRGGAGRRRPERRGIVVGGGGPGPRRRPLAAAPRAAERRAPRARRRRRRPGRPRACCTPAGDLSAPGAADRVVAGCGATSSRHSARPRAGVGWPASARASSRSPRPAGCARSTPTTALPPPGRRGRRHPLPLAGLGRDAGLAVLRRRHRAGARGAVHDDLLRARGDAARRAAVAPPLVAGRPVPPARRGAADPARLRPRGAGPPRGGEAATTGVRSATMRTLRARLPVRALHGHDRRVRRRIRRHGARAAPALGRARPRRRRWRCCSSRPRSSSPCAAPARSSTPAPKGRRRRTACSRCWRRPLPRAATAPAARSRPARSGAAPVGPRRRGARPSSTSTATAPALSSFSLQAAPGARVALDRAVGRGQVDSAGRAAWASSSRRAAPWRSATASGAARPGVGWRPLLLAAPAAPSVQRDPGGEPSPRRARGAADDELRAVLDAVGLSDLVAGLPGRAGDRHRPRRADAERRRAPTGRAGPRAAPPGARPPAGRAHRLARPPDRGAARPGDRAVAGRPHRRGGRARARPAPALRRRRRARAPPPRWRCRLSGPDGASAAARPGRARHAVRPGWPAAGCSAWPRPRPPSACWPGRATSSAGPRCARASAPSSGILAAVEVLAFLRGPLRYAERLVGHDAALRALTAMAPLALRPARRPACPAGLAGWRSGDLLARAIDDVDALQDLYLRTVLPVTIAVGAAVHRHGGGRVHPALGRGRRSGSRSPSRSSCRRCSRGGAAATTRWPSSPGAISAQVVDALHGRARAAGVRGRRGRAGRASRRWAPGPTRSSGTTPASRPARAW